jgi:hypothetical protein
MVHDRGMMQELKRKLQEMYGRSFRAIPGVFLVEYTDGPDGDFFIIFHYRTRDGEKKVFRKHFDNHYVFGSSCNEPNRERWQPRMRVCRFGMETISDVLGAMGVSKR